MQSLYRFQINNNLVTYHNILGKPDAEQKRVK